MANGFHMNNNEYSTSFSNDSYYLLYSNSNGVFGQALGPYGHQFCWAYYRGQESYMCTLAGAYSASLAGLTCDTTTGFCRCSVDS